MKNYKKRKDMHEMIYDDRWTIGEMGVACKKGTPHNDDHFILTPLKKENMTYEMRRIVA